MEDSEEYSPESLQRCSYRFLQQTAKGLNLPSNVKKVYLIQLIHAKKYCSAEQVETLVRQVRMERQHLALARKRAKNKRKHIQQSTEISSTSNSKSPPITTTPKRLSHIMIRYSPDQYSPAKQRTYKPPNRNIPATSTINASDRVLRSFRSYKNPNYVLNNALIGIISSSSSEESIKSVGRVSKDERKVNVRSLVKRGPWRNGNEIVPVPRKWKSDVVPAQRKRINISPQIVKRQRRLSGIYPLNEETKAANIPNVSVRRADGSLSKLTAFIQKPLTQSNHNQEAILNICEPDKSEHVPNNSNTGFINTETVLNYDSNIEEISKENQGEYTVYYHKKIRAEQVRSLRTKEMAKCVGNDYRLPKINDVFTKFSSVYGRDVTQPIYVQVNNEPEMSAPNPPFMYPDIHGYQTTMLESLYNIKNIFIVNQPLLQIATTANTRCVYSTPVISTAKAQPSTNVSNLYNIALSQDSPQYFMDDSRVHEFIRTFRCEETLSDDTIEIRRSSSSAESLQSQDLGANVTIPEMVEDALELISQDGDYMERMGMDIRMQCILCNWAGPKIILEYHIRKEHTHEIIQCVCSEYRGTYTLGELVSVRNAWLSTVLEWDTTLYVLSAKYEDPDCFCATLATLSSDEEMPITGSVTTYNKVSGEPFTWKGLIQQLPPTLQYENEPIGLKLELSKMNLLPNSANLKLLNRELVIRSPTKVVVGQPELNNIHIPLIVKLYD